MTFSELRKKVISCTEINPPLSFQEMWDYLACELPENPAFEEWENRLALEEWEKEWAKTDYTTKKRINEEIRKTNREIEDWMERKRKKTSAFAEYEIEKCVEKKNKLKARLSYLGKIKPGDDKERAKLVPITSFLTFTPAGFTPCIFHKTPGERSETPSLKYWSADNHVYCFSCTKRGDAIDCMMAKEGLDFNSAVKRLLNT